jgi:hypothetical protein
MLNMLQDPMGVPFFPQVFDALMVLTFALHIVCVNLTLGALAVAVWGRLKPGTGWDKLSPGLARTATATVSAAIVLGVAPLLFVQVIYDPFWYAANLLSADWVIGFVFVMIAAFWSAYLFYLGGKDDRGPLFFGFMSLGLFLVAGTIMHALSVQLLHPEKWLGWYASVGGAETSGSALHAFEPARFLHFMIPALTVVGVYMMIYAWYKEPRADADRAHLDWTAQAGANLAFWSALAEGVVGVWWLMTLPKDFHFYRSPLLMGGAGLGVILIALLGHVRFGTKRPQDFCWPVALVTVVTVLGMAATREALRQQYVGAFGYTIHGHRLTMDWASTALFFGTFVFGLAVLGYQLTVAFLSGRTAGRWEAGPKMQAWGRVSIGILLAWIAVVAGLGVVWTLRRHGL